jgi:hypothetical protein
MQLNVLFVFQPLHRFLYLFYYECVFVHMIPVKMKQFSVALSATFKKEPLGVAKVGDFIIYYTKCSKRKQIRAGVANYRPCRSGILYK